MKIYKCIKLCIHFIFFLGISFSGFAQEETIVWDFPVNPDTEEWKNLKTYDERLKAYNIPDDIIKKISTAELVKTCLAYPEWGLIYAYNDRLTGLSVVLHRFNGFHELFLRNDAAKELIKVFTEMNPLATDPNWSPLQRGLNGFKFTCIEMLLSIPVILDKLDNNELQILLDEAVLKFRSKQQRPDFYSLWALSPTAGLCLNILEKHGTFVSNDFNLKLFQRRYISEDIETLNMIVEISEKTKL